MRQYVIMRKQIYTLPSTRREEIPAGRGVFGISRWRKQDNRFPPTDNRRGNRKRLRDINLTTPRGPTWSRAILALRERNLSVEGSLVSFGRRSRNETARVTARATRGEVLRMTPLYNGGY